MQTHYVWLRKSPSCCCWQLRECSGEARLPPCLRCCNTVILAIAQRQENWVRWSVVWLSMALYFGLFILLPFFLFLLMSACSAAAALLRWQGKNHWCDLRCAAGPASSELKVLPDLSKRLVSVPRLRQCLNSHRSEDRLSLIWIYRYLQLRMFFSFLQPS